MNERIRDDVDLSQLKGPITHGPFANPMLQAIIRKYGKGAFGRSSACMEFETFLQYIRAGRTDGTCLEIGTFHGITALILSQYFEHVICVTKEDAGAKPMKHELVKFLGLKNIEFHDITDNSQKKPLVDSLQFDFCYQDGDHTNDTLTDFDLVKRCGNVLFHEYWPLQPPVWNLVNSLPQEQVQRAAIDSFAFWSTEPRQNPLWEYHERTGTWNSKVPSELDEGALDILKKHTSIDS